MAEQKRGVSLGLANPRSGPMRFIAIIAVLMLAASLGSSSAWAMGKGKASKKAKKAIAKMDKDGDGKVSFAEWKGKGQRFQGIDTNSDGYVTEEELRIFFIQKP